MVMRSSSGGVVLRFCSDASARASAKTSSGTSGSLLEGPKKGIHLGKTSAEPQRQLQIIGLGIVYWRRPGRSTESLK